MELDTFLDRLGYADSPTAVGLDPFNHAWPASLTFKVTCKPPHEGHWINRRTCVDGGLAKWELSERLSRKPVFHTLPGVLLPHACFAANSYKKSLDLPQAL